MTEKSEREESREEGRAREGTEPEQEPAETAPPSETVAAELPARAPKASTSPEKRRRLELMAVFGGFALLGIGFVVASPSLRPKGEPTARTMKDLTTLREAGLAYRREHPTDCPTPLALVAEKQLSTEANLEDAWGETLRLDCNEQTGDVEVRSSGADREWWTADDLGIPASATKR
jgi:hypothetical protein